MANKHPVFCTSYAEGVHLEKQSAADDKRQRKAFNDFFEKRGIKTFSSVRNRRNFKPRIVG